MHVCARVFHVSITTSHNTAAQVDYINGVIIREGEECGVATPVNKRVLEAVMRCYSSFPLSFPASGPLLFCVQSKSSPAPHATSLCNAWLRSWQVKKFEREKQVPRLSSKALYELAGPPSSR